MNTQEIKIWIGNYDRNHKTNLLEQVEDICLYWRQMAIGTGEITWLEYQQAVDSLYQKLYTEYWQGDKNKLFDYARQIQYKTHLEHYRKYENQQTQNNKVIEKTEKK